MKNKLQIEQLSKKIKAHHKLQGSTPTRGWVHAIRSSLGMSLQQFGKRMNMTAQSAAEIEERERDGSISLNSLDKAAQALGLKLNYGFYNPGKNLEEMLDHGAKQAAKKIVYRTHKTMQLEDQANSKSRLKRAIKEKAIELVNKKSKSIWD